MKKRISLFILSLLLIPTLVMPLSAFAAGSGGGGSIFLGGSGEHVQVNSLDVTSSFTLEMWAKYTAENFAPTNALLCFGYYHPHFGLDYGRPYLEGQNPICSRYLTRNVWTHLAVTYNGTSHISNIYVNGEAWATRDNQINTTGEGFAIGYSPWGSYNSFYGEIDEVRVWDTELDHSTIKTWMNKSLDSSHPAVSDNSANHLIGYWKFDETSGTNAEDYADDISPASENDGTLTSTNGDEWITSTAPVGDASHLATGTGSLSETSDVAVDITWDNDPGSSAIFSAIQINDSPGVTTGLPGAYPERYWEIWMDYDDSSYQADASFHFDDIEGITSESGLALYTRSSAGSGWSEVAGWTLNNEGDNADGEGYITANDLTGFSQFIIVDDGGAVNPLPEPSTLVLLGAGMIIFCSYFIFRRRTVKNTGHL